MSRENPDLTPKASPLLIILSGPSGVGKDAVLARMKERGLPFHYVTTATTRRKRVKERDGVDYHFISEEQFQQMIESEQLLEWAKVYDNYYGVPRKEIEAALGKGQDVIVKVDVQGAITITRILPGAVSVFLMPDSIEELAGRLRQRNSESTSELNLRLDKARDEMKSLPIFDYIIVSHRNKLDLIISQLNAVVTAEKCRVKPRVLKL